MFQWIKKYLTAEAEAQIVLLLNTLSIMISDNKLYSTQIEWLAHRKLELERSRRLLYNTALPLLRRYQQESKDERAQRLILEDRYRTLKQAFVRVMATVDPYDLKSSDDRATFYWATKLLERQ